MAYELSRPRMAASWSSDGLPHTWKEGDVDAYRAPPSTSRRASTSTPRPSALLADCSSTSRGTDPDTTAKIVDAIQDWRDPDDFGGRTARKQADYRAAGLTQKPSNAPFETVSEVSRVMGVTPAIYARIADSLTVHSRQPGINARSRRATCCWRCRTRRPRIVDAYLAAARGRAGREAADPAVPAGRELRRGRRAGVAHPRHRPPRPMV